MWANLQHLPIEAGPLCSFLSSCTWAVGATAYSALSEKYSSPSVNFSRSLVALPLFCLALFFVGGQSSAAFLQIFELKTAHWFWFSASILGSFALGDTLFLLSTQALGVPSALAISSTFPIWSALAGWLFLGNPFRPTMGIGVALIVAGTVWVILSGKKAAHKNSPAANPKRYWLGVSLAIGTSFFWALNVFALSLASEGLSPIFANVVRALVSLILCPIVGALLYRGSFRAIPFRQLKAPLWIFVLEAFGGSLLFMYGIRNAPLATASALSSLAPVIAVCLAWILGKQLGSRYTALAITTVVAGIWILVAGI